MAGIAPRPTPNVRLHAVAAATTVLAAVGMDVLAEEHPTHIVGLGLVAIVVAALRLKLAGRYPGLFSAVSGALVAQPALHATSKIGGTAGGGAHADNLLHVIVNDGPATAMQVVATALIVLAVASCTQLLELLNRTLRRPLRLLAGPPPESTGVGSLPVRTIRPGSMLRWCGWAIQAARRGPPSVPATATG